LNFGPIRENPWAGYYTVPTRAWPTTNLPRARSWDVGITTGDCAGKLDAGIVATLETQKRLIGAMVTLLVVDNIKCSAMRTAG
jgi:hypothetical protein